MIIRAALTHFLFAFLCAGMAAGAVAQDGQLDATFGESGTVRTNTAVFEYPSQVFATSDGGLLVAASAGSGGLSPLFVKYLADGHLDPTFGDGGVRLLAGLSPPGRFRRYADGRMAAAITTSFGAYRFLPDGRLDPSFGEGGQAVVDGSVTTSYEVLPLSGGGLIVAGRTLSQGLNRLVRLTEAGAVDSTFGEGGVASVPTTGGAPTVLVQTPDGRFVMGWDDYEGGRGYLVRFTSGGMLDPAFGSEGVVATGTLCGGTFMSMDAVFDENGALLVAGRCIVGTTSDEAVLRLRSDGTLDPTFADGGVLTGHDEPTYYDHVLPDGSGRILLTSALWVSRRFADGSPDLTFGQGGHVRTEPPTGWPNVLGGGLALQSDGRIVLAASVGMPASPPEPRDLFVVRLTGSRVTGTEPSETLPRDAAVRAWPSPLQGAGHVDVVAPSDGTLRLELFDVMGRCVALVFEGHAPSGRSEFAWSAVHLPAGHYTLRATFDGGLHAMAPVVVVR